MCRSQKRTSRLLSKAFLAIGVVAGTHQGCTESALLRLCLLVVRQSKGMPELMDHPANHLNIELANAKPLAAVVYSPL